MLNFADEIRRTVMSPVWRFTPRRRLPHIRDEMLKEATS